MKPTLITALTLALLTLIACSDEPENGGVLIFDGGALNIAPNPVIFASVQLGATATIDITLSNLSADENLEIRNVRLVEDTLDDPAGEEFFTGNEWFRSATLRPGEERLLAVEYRPADEIADTGKIELDVAGDSTIAGNYEIQIQTAALDPDIRTQDRIEFPTTAPGAPPRFATAEVENAGHSPLLIRNAALTGATEFAVAYYGANPDAVEPSDQPETPPQSVEPGDSFWFRIFFEPNDRAPRTAQLTFQTNDPDEELFAVDIAAPQQGPCVSGSRRSIDFGEANIGYINGTTYSVSSCSDEPLTITRIAVVDSADGRFSVANGSLPAFPAGVEPGDQLEFNLVFRPEDTNMSTADLLIASDDPAVPILRVPLAGRGSVNACPTALPRAIPVGQARPARVIPIGNPTTLDASQSFDPDGQVARYEWSLLEAPAGAIPQLAPSAQVESPTFIPTHYGTYRFELEVFDDAGRASCAAAVVSMTTIPDGEIAVVLRWQTPGDPDPSDEVAADLDLHFRHPLGQWNQPPFDVFSANPTADWGPPGPAGNPILTQPNGAGPGPELLSLGSPETSLSYAIGAYVFDDRGMGQSVVTIDVFSRGLLIYSDSETVADGEFWQAVDVTWSTLALTPVNRVTVGFP